MSDPMVNAEIEDVLSSIRRLVSSEERAGHDRPDSEPELEPEQRGERQAGARLVLTPSQRIDEAHQTGELAGIDAEVEAPPTQAGAPEMPDGIEDAEIVEAQAAEGAAENSPEDTAQTAGHDPGVPQGADEAMAGETREAVDAPDGEDEGAGIGVLEARIASFESAVARQQSDWEPDDGLTAENAATPVAPLPWHDIDDETAPADDEAEGEDRATGLPRDDGPADRIGEPETRDVPAQALDDGQPGESDAEYAGPDDADRGTGEGTGEGEGFWLGEDTILDEDALRDLVSEIVRQELQGALGERITRNVRKLVRREINRALTSQELEE